MSTATPLFYSNRMITHCLEARGRYIIDDPLFRLKLCPVIKYNSNIYIYYKSDSKKREEIKKTRKGLPVGPDTCLSGFHVFSDRYSQGKACTFVLCKK